MVFSVKTISRAIVAGVTVIGVGVFWLIGSLIVDNNHAKGWFAIAGMVVGFFYGRTRAAEFESLRDQKDNYDLIGH